MGFNSPIVCRCLIYLCVFFFHSSSRNSLNMHIPMCIFGGPYLHFGGINRTKRIILLFCIVNHLPCTPYKRQCSPVCMCLSYAHPLNRLRNSAVTNHLRKCPCISEATQSAHTHTRIHAGTSNYSKTKYAKRINVSK